MTTKTQEIRNEDKRWDEVYCLEGYTMTDRQKNEMYLEVYKPIEDAENKIKENNKSLMKQIKGKVSGSLYYGICAYLKDLKSNCYHNEAMEYKIVDKPNGDLQKESWSKEFQSLWIDQWSTGDSGDSYSGYVYIKLTKNEFLRVNYSM